MTRRPAPIVPTARAVVLLALAAPVALVIAATRPDAWLVAPLAGLAVLALVLADALLAGRLEDLHIAVPGDVAVGAAESLQAGVRLRGGMAARIGAARIGAARIGAARIGAARIGAARTGAARMGIALECDPRLAPGGRMDFALERVPESADREWRGAGAFAAGRRGTAKVSRAWLRWTGPLGLGARQFLGDLDEDVRIWPNLGDVRSPAMQTFLKDAQFGLIARRMRGEGTQFEALAEYQPGMDRRRIDWKASARHVHLYAKEFETERNNQIVLAFDCGQAMCEPIRGMPRLDRAVSAALATGYVALKGGDRVALFGFASRPEVSTPFVAASGEFHRLQRAAAGLEYRAEEPNFTLALATLAGRLQRRSLIVVFSDFADPTSAELMIESIGRLVSRHVVLFVTMNDDELESLSAAPPGDLEAFSEAVAADLLLRQRALVTRRLRQIGVDVVEAPFDRIGTRLLDAYMEIKRSGAIG